MEKSRIIEILKIFFSALAILGFLALCLAVPSIAAETGTTVAAIRAEIGAVPAGTPVADIRAELGVVPPGTTVVVLQGDTYSAIAQKFCEGGVRNLLALTKANGISVKEADLIFPGDSIFIPSGLLKSNFRDPLRKLIVTNNKLGALSAENTKLSSSLVDARGEIINLGNSLHKRISKEIIAAIAAIAVIIFLTIVTFILRRQNDELVKNKYENLETTDRLLLKEEIVFLAREKRKLQLALNKERKLTDQLMEALSERV